MTSTNARAGRPTWRSETVSSAVRASAIVLLGALLVGGLSSPGQQYLPSWLSSLANSAGGWSMFAFALVWLSRARPVLGVVLGVVAFEVMLEAYGVVSLWRGFFYATPFTSSWAFLGVFAGLALGFGAALARYGRPAWRIVGVLPLSVVLVTEGAYGLLVIADTTSPVYWAAELVAGAVFFAVALVRSRRG